MGFETGAHIGDYEIVGTLGAGGMGRVYKVRSIISDRLEAMKILLPNLTTEPELADRFLREIKVLASLTHPNIAALHAAFRFENQLIMVMELVEGTTLEEKLRQGSVPLVDGVDYLAQVLSALSYAHARGVVHRDIKPGNMMVTADGIVKLMDFGIARAASERKLTMTGTTLGSIYYMSPEQVEGRDIDGRSDLYSVGVCLYEVATGKKPFEGDSNYAIMAAHLKQAPVPPIEVDPNIPHPLNEIIMMVLAKDPAQRFQSADAFRNALESAKGALGVVAKRAAEATSSSPFLNSTGGATAVMGGPAAATSLMGATAPLESPSTSVLPSPQPPTPPIQSPSANPPTPSPPLRPPAQPLTATGPVQGPPVGPPAPAASEPDSLSGVASSGRKGDRLAYIVVGAVLALIVIFFAAMGVPRYFKKGPVAARPQVIDTTQPAPASTQPAASQTEQQNVNASGTEASPAPETQAGPAGSPQPAGGAAGVSEQQAPAPATPVPAVKTVAGEHPAGLAKHASRVKAATEPGGTPATQPLPADQGAASANSASSNNEEAAAAAANQKALEELQDDMVKLTSRSSAVKATWERIRQQNEASGYGLNHEKEASLSRLDQYLNMAQNALNAGDTAATRKYMDKAEAEVERLQNR
jgi:serine/threonine-protein kinase